MDRKERHLPAKEIEETHRIEAAIHATKELYQNGTAAYAEQLHRYDTDIASFKHRITQQRSRLVEKEKKLHKLETAIEVQLRMVERINRDIHAKIDLILSMKHALENESPDAYNRFFKQEKERLRILSDEAETMETELLEMELNRLNLLDTVIPIRNEIERLEQQLHLLETEKQAFQNSALHNLPKLALPKENRNDTEGIVETEIEE